MNIKEYTYRGDLYILYIETYIVYKKFPQIITIYINY